MLNKTTSLLYLLSNNLNDTSDDQDGQLPSLQMPCSSTEFHYTEQRHCCRHPALTFQYASPRGNANFQYLLTGQPSNVLLPATCWEEPWGSEVFSDMFVFQSLPVMTKFTLPLSTESERGDSQGFSLPASLFCDFERVTKGMQKAVT